MPPIMSMSLEHARELWPDNAVEKVEHWNQYGRGGLGIRQDLFGFADVLSDGPNGTFYIQVTTKGCRSARWKKLTGHLMADETEAIVTKRMANIKSVLNGGSKVLIWSWHQPMGKGTRWEMDEKEVTLSDLKLD